MKEKEEQNPTHLGRFLVSFLTAFFSASSWNSVLMSCSNFCLGPGQIAPPTTHPVTFPSLPLYNQTFSSGTAEYQGPLAYHRFKKKGFTKHHILCSHATEEAQTGKATSWKSYS